MTIFDYLSLYRKFTYIQQESYALDYIGEAELGQKKLDYSEYGTLNELYKNDYQKFLDYNIRDVVLVEKLDDKMKLLEQACTIAYDAGVNLIDSLTSVRMWDIIIHNFLMEKNIVVPPKPVIPLTAGNDPFVDESYLVAYGLGYTEASSHVVLASFPVYQIVAPLLAVTP